MGYHRCEEDGCKRKGQTATNGCSLFCIAHMRKRGLEPRQKQCQEAGCAKQVATSTDGSRIYCWAHMKHHGLQPRQHKCTVKDCTKRVQTSSDGQRIYCISHMKSFNMKPRQPYCQYQGCKKRAHYSAAGQRTHCIGHMRKQGLCPQPRTNVGVGALVEKSDEEEDDPMATDEGSTHPGTGNGAHLQDRQPPAQEPPSPSPNPANPHPVQSRSPPTTSTTPSVLEELEDMELLKLAELLLESGIGFQEVLSLVTALQEHEKSSSLLGSPDVRASSGTGPPRSVLNALGIELGQLLGNRTSSLLSGSLERDECMGEGEHGLPQEASTAQQRLAYMLNNHATVAVADDAFTERQLLQQSQQSMVNTPFGLCGADILQNAHTLGFHTPATSSPTPADTRLRQAPARHLRAQPSAVHHSPTSPFPRQASPLGQSVSTISSPQPDCPTPLAPLSRTISSANNAKLVFDNADPGVNTSPSSSSLSSANPSSFWNAHMNTARSMDLPAAAAYDITCSTPITRQHINMFHSHPTDTPVSPPGLTAARHHTSIPHRQPTGMQVSNATLTELAALNDSRAHTLHATTSNPTGSLSHLPLTIPGLPTMPVSPALSPTLRPQVVASVVPPQPQLQGSLSPAQLRRTDIQLAQELQLDAHDLSLLDELSDEDLLAVVMAAQARLGRGRQMPTDAVGSSHLSSKSTQQLGVLHQPQGSGGGMGGALTPGMGMKQPAQHAGPSWHQAARQLQENDVHSSDREFLARFYNTNTTSQQSSSVDGSLLDMPRNGHSPGGPGQATAVGNMASSERGGTFSTGQRMHAAFQSDAASQMDLNQVTHMLAAGQANELPRGDSYLQGSGISSALLSLLSGTGANGPNRDQIIAELMLSLIEEEEAAAAASLMQQAALDSLGEGQYLQLLSALRTQQQNTLAASSFA